MARCYSRDKQNDPLEKKSSKSESSDADSDSDIDYVPHLVIKSGNDDEKMSCFSEDKLPSSFINEVVSISSNIIVLRSSIQNLGECNKWILEFGNLTNTKWNTRTSRPCGTRFLCSKKYVCHRSTFMKVPAEKNSRSFSKNSGCLAKICIKVKLKTSATKRKDLFIKRGLLAMITIIDGHNHRLNTADDLKYLPNPECREKFFKYFCDGMSVAESHRYHKKTVQLNHKRAEGGLANGSIIPSKRTVQYWHEVWRLKKTGNIIIEKLKKFNANEEMEAGSSQNADDIEEEMKVKSSGSDSDSDVDYKPLLDVMTGNIKENMSCFSEDKLPSSFINEVTSISSNTIVVRSNVQNIEECNKWISEFGNLTNTKWNIRDSRPCGQRFAFWKKYVCHRSKFRKVPAEENKRGFSKNAGCLATINIKVKLKTSSTKWKDSFVLKGLLAIITIKDVHNHCFNSEVNFKYRSKSYCKEKFSDGMGVAESLKYHIKTCQLGDKVTEGDLSNSCINNPGRRVHNWYDWCRVQNCSKKTGKGIIEGAGSSKDADDIDKGASTSKLPEVDGGNQNRPVLSLKCLHEDTDDEGSSSKMEEDDPSSKFIDVNDVPELPLNDKDEHQVDDVLKPESDAEEHPNLEPVVKKLLAMRPIVPKPPAIEPVVQKPPAIEPVVQKPPATEPVVQKPPAMILIPVVNISAQTPVIPLRTSHEGVYNFRIKIDCSSAPKRSDCAVFSESRNKLYVCKDVPFIVYVSANNVPEGSMICVQAVFSRPEHACASVTRCPTHAQQDYARGSPAYEHFVQCMNDGAIYEKNLKNSKMSVSVPYEKPPDGEAFSSYLFKLTCFNSCVGGINRRPFFLVFTLERNKFMLGRQTIEAKVCACPSRDCKSEDDKEGRRTQNDAQVVSQQDVVAKAAVNIQPRPAVNSQPRPTGSSQPRPAGSSQPLGRSQSSGSQKPKYTITVKDRETFEFLQHMKVLYEMNVDPMIPDT